MPNEKNKGYEYMGFKMKGKAQRLLLTLAVSMAGIFCTACKNPIVEAGTGQEDEGMVEASLFYTASFRSAYQ